ncbi:SelT/SelW/SelH family protein [Streptomyces sp. 6N223]|uniref:SelT/SelW/SelH family protein n=1 Tax=Streptomyces sp. 6N223 TaxID=3457412 RepID=UPI003FD2E09C
MKRIEIEYCTRCRWLPRAVWLAQELLGTFEADVAEVALVPGTGGVFRVRVDGETVWDRHEQGFPEPSAVKRLVRDRVAPGRDLGHVEEARDPGGQGGQGG